MALPYRVGVCRMSLSQAVPRLSSARRTHAGPPAITTYVPPPVYCVQDSAVVGEAAALGIGMVMLGSANKEICDELVQYGQVC